LAVDQQFAPAWLGRGETFNAIKRFSEALQAFDQALEFEGNLARAWQGKAIALQKLGQIDEALTAFARAGTLDGTDATLWIARGSLLLSLHRDADAWEDFERAIETDPNHIYIWHAWSGKTQALRNLGRVDEAFDAGRRGLALRIATSKVPLGSFIARLIDSNALATTRSTG
jgi:tetratricopeptide (TPR) repeat protein